MTTDQDQIQQLTAQLAAAREALRLAAPQHLGFHSEVGKAIREALATPSPAADALLEDKARLDWLDTQSNGDPWIARQSETGRGYRLHNSTRHNGSATVREAIDAARKASTKEPK